MNSHYTYFAILAASLVGPACLSFDKKVAFYKKWKSLFPAMILPILIYVVWDILFTSKGIWGFNASYITGTRIATLPIEEIIFFLVVPYCCIFIYECVRTYLPKVKNNQLADRILQLLGAILFVGSIAYRHRAYTCWTFFLLSSFISIIYIWRSFFIRFDAISFLLSYSIILVPFLIINGFLTAIPVVVYNNRENLGIRIYTIPLEDAFYGMLLMLLVICIYERLVKRI